LMLFFGSLVVGFLTYLGLDLLSGLFWINYLKYYW
jgi:hypothetical protein